MSQREHKQRPRITILLGCQGVKFELQSSESGKFGANCGLRNQLMIKTADISLLRWSLMSRHVFRSGKFTKNPKLEEKYPPMDSSFIHWAPTSSPTTPKAKGFNTLGQTEIGSVSAVTEHHARSAAPVFRPPHFLAVARPSPDQPMVLSLTASAVVTGKNSGAETDSGASKGGGGTAVAAPGAGARGENGRDILFYRLQDVGQDGHRAWDTQGAGQTAVGGTFRPLEGERRTYVSRRTATHIEVVEDLSKAIERA